MIGVSEDIAKRYTDTDLARLFDKFGHHGEVRVIYERPNGDRPSPLPSSRHLSYVSKGWTAVEIVDTPVSADITAIVISSDIRDHANIADTPKAKK